MSDAATLFNKYKTAPKGGVFSMEGSGSSWDIQIYDWSEGQSDQKLITLRNGLTKTNRCAGRFFKVGTEFQFTIVSMKGTFPPSAQTALRQQLKNATITLQKSSAAQADEDRLQKMLAGGGDKSDAQQLGMNEDELDGLDLMFGDEAGAEEAPGGAEADGLGDLGDLADLDGLAGLVDGDDAEAEPAYPGQISQMKVSKAQLELKAAADAVGGELSKLGKAVAAFSKDNDLGDGADTQKAIEGELGRIHGETLNNIDALFNATSAGDAAASEAAWKSAVQYLSNQEKLLSSDPVFAHLKNNPWGIDPIAPFVKALGNARKSLGA